MLCAVAATGGSVRLNNVNPNHIDAIINKLEECGCNIEVGEKTVFLSAPKRLSAIEIKTLPYPGFPTDMQQIFSAMLVKAKGTSVIIENIFENRFKHLSELRKMGAKVTIEGKTAIIRGVKRVNGATTVCTDLRGGAALIVAAIMARGRTKIENIDFILRGYEGLDKKLNKLGAKIKYQEE